MAQIVISVLVVLVLLWWIFEYRRHNWFLEQIPVRIHINGSRGKSSVTRLIGGALRQAGMKVVTKTTGTNARFIYPDGHEEPIVRTGPADIKEQRWVVRKTAKLGAEALVTECMAIDPELQWILQHKFIKAPIAVITNVREDHLDVMGPTIDDVADALCGVMPEGGVCFTAESKLLNKLEDNAKSLRCRLIYVSPDLVSDDEMKQFSYIEHKENVALALAVAQHLGIERSVALQGMWGCNPDPGVLRIFRVQVGDCIVEFANAFAANDPQSTLMIWNMIRERISKDARVVVIANSRKDRPQRAMQIPDVMHKIPAEKYIVVGTLTKPIVLKLRKLGVEGEKVWEFPEGKPEEIIRFISNLGDRVFVFAVGNIGGVGHRIVDYIEGMVKAGKTNIGGMK